MPSEAPGFARLQTAFAAHIRDPAAHPLPEGVDDRRMAVYRDLLFNNVRDFLAGTFPVLRRIYGEAGWSALIREYFARHRAHTPLFLQMPREFLAWLDDERGARPEDPPFLRELAHYEWVELALSVDSRDPDDPALGGFDAQGDLLHGVPVLSPLAWPLAYTWPVHRIGPDFQPQEPPRQPTYLLVYRDRADAVGFLEMNPVTARLVELIGAEPAPTGRAALERIAGELSHPEPDVVISGGLGILEDLRRRDVILGSRAGA